MRLTFRRFACICLFVLGATAGITARAPAAEPLPTEERTYFESKIRPLLIKHCYECHSAEAAELGGKLRLDTRAGVLQGGESGPAVVPGKPDASPLIQAIRYQGLEMPPDKPLPEAVVAELTRWVARGAPDPRDEAAAPKPPAVRDTQSAPPPTLWSLKPIANPQPPAVKENAWATDPVDRFVLAGVEAAGFLPTPPADPRTLIRRLAIDLLGLPPTWDEVQQFEADYGRRGEAAVIALVDRMLAQPQFGERWGRHWLDVARFGESNGNDGLGRNPTFPHAWRYRDYVLDAVNRDLPYDRFLEEQIAGDLLPAADPAERDRLLVATGFLALTAKPAKAMNENFEMDIVADQIDLIGRGVLGLSVACARCHDHKFDPVPTRDYYSLAGIFTSTETLWGTAAHEGLTAPATDLHVLAQADYVPPPAGFTETVLVLDSNTGTPKPIPKSKWPAGTALAMGVRDRGKVGNTKINIKGESKKTGEEVPRGFLSAVPLATPLAVDPAQSGRRQLAQWLTAPEQPLTARVMVNRIWLHLFGAGLVRTADDFGTYGEPPTHPELLDHLARRFVADGWSVKRLVRALVLTQTYRQASQADPALLAADPQNRLLARHDRRRLDAEALRDSMLRASGVLEWAPRAGSLVGHRDILINLAGNLHEPSRHRSVYLCYLRSAPPPELAAFDLPEFTSVVGQRETSTVSSQALHLFNSPFVAEQAAALGQRIQSAATEPEQRVRVAWRLVFAREANIWEQSRAVELVQASTAAGLTANQAWASLAQALLATNEFRYVD